MNPNAFDNIYRLIESDEPPQHFVVMKSRSMGKTLTFDQMYKLYEMSCPICDAENDHFDEDLFHV
jgi:hypothetical protein